MGGGVGAKIDLFFPGEEGKVQIEKSPKPDLGFIVQGCEFGGQAPTTREEKTDMNVTTGGGSFRFPLNE